MRNKKIVFVSILAGILATGLLALNPSTIRNSQAIMYYDEYDDNTYYKDDNNRYGYDNDKKKSSDAKVQNIKCNNIIINKNGEDVDQPPQDGDLTAAATLQGLDNKNSAIDEETSWLAALNEESQGNINLDKNVVNVCINKNNNQITVGEPIEQPPEPPTCEGCFGDLSPEQIDDIFPIEFGGGVAFQTLQALCETLDGDLTDQQRQDLYLVVSTGLIDAGSLSVEDINAVLDCLEGLGLIIAP